MEDMLHTYDNTNQTGPALEMDLQFFGEDSEPTVEPADPPAEPPADPVGPKPSGNNTVNVEQVMAFLGNASKEMLFKIPAIQKLVENARSEEKDKVYKTIQSKDNKIEELTAQLEEANAKLMEKSNENLSEQELLKRQIDALNTQLQSLTDSIEAEREAAEAEKRKAKFEAYKERRLRELAETKTEYLPDLLGGETEEEFDASVDKAIARYAELKAELLAGVKPEKPRKPSTPPVTNPSAGQVKPLTPEEIRRMSADEYAKHREQILRQAREGNI